MIDESCLGASFRPGLLYALHRCSLRPCWLVSVCSVERCDDGGGGSHHHFESSSTLRERIERVSATIGGGRRRLVTRSRIYRRSRRKTFQSGAKPRSGGNNCGTHILKSFLSSVNKYSRKFWTPNSGKIKIRNSFFYHDVEIIEESFTNETMIRWLTSRSYMSNEGEEFFIGPPTQRDPKFFTFKAYDYIGIDKVAAVITNVTTY